jgi:hypothetical protein
MPDGQAIEHFPIGSPAGHKVVHQSDEAAVVGGFQQMNHFVSDDLFEAFPGLFCEVGVEPDGGGTVAAAAPFRFHLVHEKALDFHSHGRVPLRDQPGSGGFELAPVPLVEDGLLFCFVGGWADLQGQSAVV